MSSPQPEARQHTKQADPTKRNILKWAQAFREQRRPEGKMRPVVTLYGEGRPTIFMLTAGLDKTNEIARLTRCHFESLGFDVQACKGYAPDDIPSCWRSVVRGASVAWGGFFLPAVIEQADNSDISDDHPIIVIEDSAWPTTSCTPYRLLQLFRSHGNFWAGGITRATKRTVQERFTLDGTLILDDDPLSQRSPAGCKMFVCTLRYFRLLHRLHWLTPMSWVEDKHAHVMVRSAHLTVLPRPLVATRNHWCLSDRKCFNKQTVPAYEGGKKMLEGELLPEAHILQHLRRIAAGQSDS